VTCADALSGPTMVSWPDGFRKAFQPRNAALNVLAWAIAVMSSDLNSATEFM